MSNLKSWSLGTVEYGKYLSSAGTKVRVWVGKVMPLMKMGKPKTVRVGLNKGCLINDTKCKPTVSSTITSANYITIPTSSGEGLTGEYGKTVKIEVRNHSVDQLYAVSIEKK